MIKYIKKKINRLFASKRVMKIFYYSHKIFGEKKIGNINFDFSKKKNRIQILQEIIDFKNYKSYLEIGTFKNEVFNKIKCEKKVGVDPVMGGTVRDTSDNFFFNNSEKFDIIFIDGLHEYHQVKKDIENSIKLLTNFTDFSKIKYNYFFYNYKELMNLKEFNKILEII